MSSPRSTDRFSWLKFRVLIIGRANAGKTTILQRVCDTTESPKVYRIVAGSREEIQLEPNAERGRHNIHDELIFSNHHGYVFHDSRGFESGGEEELKIVQNFVCEKATAKQLSDRLHAIWYCIPMDGQRPSLDLKYFNSICLDKNVPIIAVFTKYDQFKLDIEFMLEDHGYDNPEQNIIDAEVKKCFEEEYLEKIEGAPRHVQLENMNNPGKHCDALIEVTAEALQHDTIAVMFLAVQHVRLENTMLIAAKWAILSLNRKMQFTQHVVNKCILYFPVLWLFGTRDLDLDTEDIDRNELFFMNISSTPSQYLSSLMARLSALTTSYQIMIAAILVLDLAAVLCYKKQYEDVNDALHLAYSQDYNIETCHAFLLQNRLSMQD